MRDAQYECRYRANRCEIAIPLVGSACPDYPSTPNADLADIPLMTATDFHAMLRVSTPADIGVRALALSNAVTGNAVLAELELRSSGWGDQIAFWQALGWGSSVRWVLNGGGRRDTSAAWATRNEGPRTQNSDWMALQVAEIVLHTSARA